jgi:large subunit ribosomal protein L35
MPKMKTHSATKKRFRVTASGKVVRRHGMKSHLLERKSSKRKRGFRKMYAVSDADAKGIKRLLGLR